MDHSCLVSGSHREPMCGRDWGGWLVQDVDVDELWRGRQGCGDKGKDARWMSLGFNQMPFDDSEDTITCEEMVPSCVPDSLLWNVGGL